MSRTFPWTWCASVDVRVPAGNAFDFMSDGMKQSRWALGSWDRRKVSNDTTVGTSLFDGKDLYVRIKADRTLMLVDYYCGHSLEKLSWEVEARIIPGEIVGLGASMCVINLMIWRKAETDREEWELVQHQWETEIYLIKGLLEREFPDSGEHGKSGDSSAARDH